MKRTDEKAEYRSFGTLIAFVLVLIGTWRVYKADGFVLTSYLLGVGTLLLAVVLFVPGALAPFHWVWMKLAAGLMWFNTRLLLGLFYYLILLPTGALYRLVSGDPLERRWKDEADGSAWVTRDEAPRPRESYLRPF